MDKETLKVHLYTFNLLDLQSCNVIHVALYNMIGIQMKYSVMVTKKLEAIYFTSSHIYNDVIVNLKK